MTTIDEIKRRIELKEQLIEITQAEIRELRKELNIHRKGWREPRVCWEK
jgi:hypothetical protein